jgi:hypothetical protein
MKSGGEGKVERTVKRRIKIKYYIIIERRERKIEKIVK